ncbi:MAG: hypothetical protein Q8R66_00035, partial [Methanobacteriaceae archaeon]|nr:hypothetical protein [Methanobacteriaceae archaeon]
TQLQRDIRYIRDFTSYTPTDNSQDSGQNDNKKPNEPPKMPDWTGDPGPEPTPEEYEDWVGTTIKLAAEVLFLVGIEIASKPLGSAGEYLSGIAGQYIKVPQAVGIIAKWFGNSRYTKKAIRIFEDVNRAIKGTWVEKVVNGIDTVIQTVGFNYGMEVFKTLLLKLFPDKAEKISLAIKMIGYGEFVSDPIGTTLAFVDVVVSFLLESDLPDRGNFEKVFIIKPLQDPNA